MHTRYASQLGGGKKDVGGLLVLVVVLVLWLVLLTLLWLLFTPDEPIVLGASKL